MKLAAAWRRVLQTLAREVAASLREELHSLPGRGGNSPSSGAALRPSLEIPAEWDPLWGEEEELSLVRLGPHTGAIGSIVVSRANDYSIDIRARTQLDPRVISDVHAGMAQGTLAEGIPIEAVGIDRSALSVRSAFVAESRRSWRLHHADVTEVKILAHSVTRTWSKRIGNEAFAMEWYLGGPSQFAFPRTTRRERIQRVSRIRGFSDDQRDAPALTFPPEDWRPGSSHSRDYLLLTPRADIRAIVAQVPTGLGPEWSHNLSIEYHFESGAIPAAETREAVAEVLGFLLGKHLLRVGTTTYDRLGSPVESESCSPWGRDVQETASDIASPPFIVESDELEVSFNGIIAQYLQRRDELELSDVVWTLWLAKRMPMGSALPLYASALERLMTAWFRSSRSRSRGTYMSKNEFDRLAAPGLAQIELSMQGAEYRDRILRRMRNAFQMGVNERFEFFFSEIGLTHGAAERTVIRSRNAAAHGGGKDEPSQALVNLEKGYQTLVNRALLTVLGHQGAYTDYSMPGYPERSIGEPMGSLDVAEEAG